MAPSPLTTVGARPAQCQDWGRGERLQPGKLIAEVRSYNCPPSGPERQMVAFTLKYVPPRSVACS